MVRMSYVDLRAEAIEQAGSVLRTEYPAGRSSADQRSGPHFTHSKAVRQSLHQ